jgi:hypothetical protein
VILWVTGEIIESWFCDEAGAQKKDFSTSQMMGIEVKNTFLHPFEIFVES